MAEQGRDPKAILAEAIRKRDELNIFIRMYQEMLGVAATSVATAASPAPLTEAPSNGRHSESGGEFDPLSAVYPGMFFGKSQPQAARLFLEQARKRPQKMKVMLAALEKGGAKVGGKKPAVNLWGVLGRNDEFVLVPKAGWGLAEWYDANALARLRNQGKKEGDAEAE